VDGVDPKVDRGYGGGRTANLFAAGKLKTLRASGGRSDGNKITWEFPADDTAVVRAELDLPADGTVWRMGWSELEELVYIDYGNTGAWLPWYAGDRDFDQNIFDFNMLGQAGNYRDDVGQSWNWSKPD
jgi:hypothetical protein